MKGASYHGLLCGEELPIVAPWASMRRLILQSSERGLPTLAATRFGVSEGTDVGNSKCKRTEAQSIRVSGINIEWQPERGTCTFDGLPVAMLWMDTTLAGVMSGVQTMVGTERFLLALQSEGRKSVEADWHVISAFPDFRDGFRAIANIAAVAGWGHWSLTSLDENERECRFRVTDSWESRYQRALGVCWGAGMLAGKLSGYCSKLFGTNCWADQKAFAARGDGCDEFVVKPSPRSIEKEIDDLLATDEATRADMAVALRRLEQEIAERQRMEEALRESEALFRSQFEFGNIGIAITSADKGWLRVNLRLSAMLGYSEEELRGRTWAEMTHPDDLESSVAQFTRMLAGEIEGYELDKRYFRKDGSIISTHLNASCFRNPDLSVRFVIASLQDITERKRTEEALRESEEKFRDVFATSSDAIFIHDARTGAILDVNQTMLKMYGWSREECAGLTVADLSADKPEYSQRAALERINEADEKGLVAFEWLAQRKDGSLFPVEVTLKKTTLVGEPCIVANVRDITERKRGEEALRQSEEKFAKAFRASPDPLTLTRLDTGEILDINDGFERAFGFPRAEALGKSTLDLGVWAHPEDREAFAQRVKREGKVREMEVVVCRRSGEGMTGLLSAEVIQVGQEPLVLSIMRDITERKRAEEALRESEEKFRNLVETTSDWIWETGADGTYTYSSPRVRALLGYEPEEVIGRKPFDFMPPDETDRIGALFTRITEERRPFFNLENLNLTKDGRSVVLETSGVPRFDAQGNLLGYRGIDRDITERKRAEEALREKEEFIRALLDTSKDWIWAIDLRGVHTYSNPAIRTLLGYEPDEIVGTSSFSLIHEEDRKRTQSEVSGCIEARRGWSNLVVRWRHKEGGYRVLESNSVPVLDAGGEVTGFRGVDRDITERTLAEAERLEMERRLLHAQKLESLGVLAGGIAHDFNNLLTAVIGNLDLALLDPSPAAAARTHIERALQAARRSADLTRQMLAYSGRGRFLVRRMELSELVRENTNLFRTAISRTVSMNLCLTRECAAIEADPAQVQQVIMNLITNASEAIVEKAGVITITTGVEAFDAGYLSNSRLNEKPPAGRFAYVEVSDTGCGMDEETTERLFDPFFTTKFMGRGLGMAAVLGIVRGHKGAIMMESTVGQGSTIRVLFPAAEAVSAAMASDSAQFPVQSGARALSGIVLVVDDEEVVRDVCATFVQTLGFHAITAADGEEGLRLFMRHTDEIGCVLLDLTMPRMDGISAFREMKRLRPDIPVILCSGYDEQEAMGHFTNEGLTGFLQKPYSLEDLKSKIEPVMKDRSRPIV